jgi:hypothetical protein
VRHFQEKLKEVENIQLSYRLGEAGAARRGPGGA